MFDHLLHELGSMPFDSFARAGGGGSSGGGGGGSSSSGGSGGDGILFLLGYAPMHGAGAILRKFAGKESVVKKIIANIIGWLVAVIYAIFWTYVWSSLGFLIGLAALFGMAAGLYGLFGKLRQSPLVKSRLQSAAAKDGAWDETKLIEHAKSVFMKYQQDWSSLNAEAMKAYLTPAYQYHAALLLYILQTMGRKDLMEEVTIADAVITNADDSDDNSKDRFTVGFTARARDRLVETKTDMELFADDSTFTEYWNFVRSGNTWLLDGITQATTNLASMNGEMVALAMKHNYRYSIDMGWLFIPKRGQLFDGSKFGSSDINNHIVGMYDNRLLIQVYTYVKNPSSTGIKPLVVAQVSVPREYGNIVVRRKKMLQMGIRGLERVETEWTKFNDKYEVYASSYEQATSFELLNPTYMEQLEALPFEVNIEVVDNVVYLYTDERGSDAATYETMLDLLDKAFKEMRL